jgi:hypothetical protein
MQQLARSTWVHANASRHACMQQQANRLRAGRQLADGACSGFSFRISWLFMSGTAGSSLPKSGSIKHRVLCFLRCVWKILSKQNHKLCCYSGISVRCSCAHGIIGGQVPPEQMSFVNSARGVRQFGFWGAFTRLPTSTTTTTSPDSLQRLRCHDDDMADPSSSSTAAAGYLPLSPLFIYLFFFLPIIQYACLDVLRLNMHV